MNLLERAYFQEWINMCWGGWWWGHPNAILGKGIGWNLLSVDPRILFDLPGKEYR